LNTRLGGYRSWTEYGREIYLIPAGSVKEYNDVGIKMGVCENEDWRQAGSGYGQWRTLANTSFGSLK
jgi:hypothetical protein